MNKVIEKIKLDLAKATTELKQYRKSNNFSSYKTMSDTILRLMDIINQAYRNKEQEYDDNMLEYIKIVSKSFQEEADLLSDYMSTNIAKTDAREYRDMVIALDKVLHASRKLHDNVPRRSL
ncbi:hypothetical protein ACH6EH_06710 [Paenibacillus sp. JSM ZJ436]|uniref:hypothetical protein n=1 Tax=Paenibacillus sp. JSM ZJ436 TaxID=3376190 RepID=UPI00378FF6EE